ncbi:uncharacterized protein IWZ02DRAFT_218685 [Phyllosticta citriasiana]|uniref:uncharacterized protein n=1 Tax=Phyllosticta citriasiana TaxID=595635 RepID=UPI0030FD404C
MNATRSCFQKNKRTNSRFPPAAPFAGLNSVFLGNGRTARLEPSPCCQGIYGRDRTREGFLKRQTLSYLQHPAHPTQASGSQNNPTTPTPTPIQNITIMVSFTLTTLVLGLLGSATALPPVFNSTAEPSAEWTSATILEKREPAKVINIGFKNADGVYYCTGYNFQGTCWHFGMEMGVCYDINDPARRGKMSSFGPDWEVTCEIFKGRGCSGKKKTVGYPGYKDLRPIFFDNQIASYNCRTMPSVQ